MVSEDAQKTQIEMLRKQQRQVFAERDVLQEKSNMILFRSLARIFFENLIIN